MKREEAEARELEALYDEKRDKLNARLPLWSLLVGLFSAFGYAGTQPGIAGYLIICYPLLAACVARFAGHNERVLIKVKRRIYAIEEASDYEGYEHENERNSTGGSGAHLKAFRDFTLLTDGISLIALVIRLFVDHLPALIILALLVEAAVLAFTWRWVRDEPTHQQSPSKPGVEQKRNGAMIRNSIATTAVGGQQGERRHFYER